MDGRKTRKDRWMDRRADGGRMGRWIRTDGRIEGQMDGGKEGQMDG